MKIHFYVQGGRFVDRFRELNFNLQLLINERCKIKEFQRSHLQRNKVFMNKLIISKHKIRRIREVESPTRKGRKLRPLHFK